MIIASLDQMSVDISAERRETAIAQQQRGNCYYVFSVSVL